VILPDFLWRVQKTTNKKFGLDLGKIFIIFLKNENFMIFKTAVRKYVGIHEKSKIVLFLNLYPQISVIKTEKILEKKCGKFS
jgi:hypothetical protein